MNIRAHVRFGLDFARMACAEVLERGSAWAVRKLMDAPGGGLPGVIAGAPAAEPLDNLRFLSEEDQFAAATVRASMRPVPKSRPTPEEDGPPNKPLVGSLEWRRQNKQFVGSLENNPFAGSPEWRRQQKR